MPKKKTTRRSISKPTPGHIRVFKTLAIAAALVTAFISGTLVQKQANAEGLAPPRFESLTASPGTTVASGTQTTISWVAKPPLSLPTNLINVVNLSDVTVDCFKISGPWAAPSTAQPASGSYGYVATSTATFQMRCDTVVALTHQILGSETRSITVTVTPPPSGGGNTGGGNTGGGTTGGGTTGGNTSGSGTTGGGTTGSGTTGTGTTDTSGTSDGTKQDGTTSDSSKKTMNNKNGTADSGKKLGFWDLFWKYWYMWLFWLLLFILILALFAYLLRTYYLGAGKKKKSDDDKKSKSSSKK